MAKRVFAAFICMAFIVFLGVSGFAADGLINITKPEGDEATFKKSYVFCGNTDKEDITVGLSVYSNQEGDFVPLETTEGETSWVIGSSGMFLKEVNLPYYGVNKIQITAYSISNPDNRQVVTYNITVLREDLKDRFINGVLRLDEVFNNSVVNLFN